MKPSYFALVVSGILIAIASVMLINEIFINKSELDNMRIINLVLFLSSAISLHGLLHMGAEIHFGYNPLETGKFIY
jgi:hypothetical protein